MARRKMRMRKIRQILDYRLSKGLSAEQTALALDIAKGSVINTERRFERSGLQWPLPENLTDTVLNEKLYPSPAQNSAEPDHPLPDMGYLRKELARPHVTLQRLWEEYRDANPKAMSRSGFYRHFEHNLPPEVTMKMIHKGGDMLFVDYSGDRLEYINRLTGEAVPVELLVCCWGASSYTYVEGTHTQKVSDFTQSQVRGLEYFGVSPKAFVPDNLKSGVTKADRYEPVMNPLYEKMASHYGAVVLPARVRAPRDKAVVESAVLHVQRFIMARLRNRVFYSLEELNVAIREELEIFNDRPMKDYGGQTRRQRFHELDRPYANPLPAEPFRITSMKLDAPVGANYHTCFENHHYSVPWRMSGQTVDIYRAGPIIEIYHDGVHACRHKAGPPNFLYTTTSEHMPPHHAHVAGWSVSWFLGKAREIGPQTEDLIGRLMSSKDHPQQGFNAARGILKLGRTYGPARLEAACGRALHFHSLSCKALKDILEAGLDRQNLLPMPLPPPAPLPHENLRGSQYYLNL